MFRFLALASLAIITAQEQGILAPNYIIASNPNVTSVNLKITTQDTSVQNDTAPLLYGIMHEDIDHSGDGGIYAEMLQNRAFQGSPINPNDAAEPYGASTSGWAPIGGVSIALDRLHPLSSALPNSLAVTIPANATGTVGVSNWGWWGFDVTPQTYNVSFYVNAVEKTYKNSTTFTAGFRSNSTGEVLTSGSSDAIEIDTFRYTAVNFTIQNNVTAADGNNTFEITFDGSALAGQTLYFALFSLFPETFKNRENGLRKDLAEAFYAIKPKFLRFPGGNNIEGQSIPTRWKWNETIGPLETRPGRVGDWGYYNTDGLGLMEYLYWCEDMEMEPVLAVYSGYSLDGTSYPEKYMPEVLEDIMAELEFLLGNTSTYWGGKRAEYGHPDPYVINYVEIGNEDMFSCTYNYRFPYLYQALSSAYPNIRFMSTQFKENVGGGYNKNCNVSTSLPDNSAYDYHVYNTPSYFLYNYDIWDNFLSSNNLTDVHIMLGEYSVFQLDTTSQYVNYSDPAGIHPLYPQMIHALGESVYQLAAERNPDVVKLGAYAPSLQNRNDFVWTPNLISFEAQANRTVLTTSYWQQWLFSNFRGSQNVPVEGDINPLYYIGNIDNSTGSFYLKIVNTGNQTVPLTLSFDTTYSSVNGTMLQSDDPNAFNFIYNQTSVIPRMMNGTDLPSMSSGSNSTGNTTSSMSSPMSSMTSMPISSANGEGAQSYVSSSTAAAKRMVQRQSSGSMYWSWTVPVFSSTVLQFDK